MEGGVEKKEDFNVAYFQPFDQECSQYRHLRDAPENAGRFFKGEIIKLQFDSEFCKTIFPKNPKRCEGMMDVYNITKPLISGGKTFIAARIEPRHINFDSKTVFFQQTGDLWIPKQHPVFSLEDPFFSYIGDEIIFGGVKLTLGKKRELKSFQTIFMRGKSIEDLKEFARGPIGQKDIRLVQLRNGKIGIFTRPAFSWFNKQIGFTTVGSLTEINAQVIADAPLINMRFTQGEWGGVNEAIENGDGSILAIGHRAKIDNDDFLAVISKGWEQVNPKLYYRPWAFQYDPLTGNVKNLGILAERADFPAGPARRKKLTDVLFTGGLELLGGNMGYLYTGISDAQAGRIKIHLPTLLGNHLYRL